MWTKKQVNIKNETYYFHNDIIAIKRFDSNMLKLDKKSDKILDIYNIGYVTIKNIDYGYDINSVNIIIFDNAYGYIEEINGDKYLVFDDTNENKELLKRYDDILIKLWIKLKK